MSAPFQSAAHHSLHPDVEKLLRVQKVDQEVARLRRDLDSLPAEEARREKRLQQLRRTADERKAAAQDAEVRSRTVEKSIKQSDDEIKKLDGRLNTVKNNAEYQATLFQIEAVRKERAQFEDEGMALLEEIETLRNAAKQAAAEVAEEEQVFAAFQGEAQKLREQRQEQVAKAAIDRPTLIQGIPRDLLDKYERLFQSRDSLAIVQLDGQVCTGCWTNVTTSEYARVVGGSSIVQCGSCQRIVYQR